jgi:hypothetical protein
MMLAQRLYALDDLRSRPSEFSSYCLSATSPKVDALFLSVVLIKPRADYIANAFAAPLKSKCRGPVLGASKK